MAAAGWGARCVAGDGEVLCLPPITAVGQVVLLGAAVGVLDAVRGKLALAASVVGPAT